MGAGHAGMHGDPEINRGQEQGGVTPSPRPVWGDRTYSGHRNSRLSRRTKHPGGSDCEDRVSRTAATPRQMRVPCTPCWAQHQGLPSHLALQPVQAFRQDLPPGDRELREPSQAGLRTHHMLHGGPSPEDDGVCEVRPLCTGRDGVGVKQSWPHAMWFLPKGKEALPGSSLGLASPLF